MCNRVESKSTRIPALDPLRYGTLDMTWASHKALLKCQIAPSVKRLRSSQSYRHETHERALLGKKLRPETMCASVTSCHSQSTARTLIICLSHIFFFSPRCWKAIGTGRRSGCEQLSTPTVSLGATLPPASATPSRRDALLRR